MAKNASNPAQIPLTKSNVVASFVEGVDTLVRELGAWRRFGEDVVAFFRDRDLSDEFDRFREKRLAVGKQSKKRR